MSNKPVLSVTSVRANIVEAEVSTNPDDYKMFPGMRVGMKALNDKLSLVPNKDRIFVVVDGQRLSKIIVNGENNPVLVRSVFAAKLGKLVVQQVSESTGGKDQCIEVL